MPIPVNPKADLRTLDFSQLGRLTDDDQQALDLLQHPGKISLDDNGDLVVINPSVKRDNIILRFFKGILTRNKAYMNEQHALDRYEKLRNNASFTKKLAQELVLASANSKGVADASAEVLSAMTLRELRIHPADRLAFTTEMVQQCLSHSEGIHSRMNVDSAFDHVAARSIRASKIFVDGEVFSARSLCERYLPQRHIATPSETGAAVLGTVISSSAYDVQELASQDEYAKLNELLSSPTLRGISQSLKEIEGNVYQHFEIRLSKLAADAIDRHRDPRDVAALVAEAYDIVVSEPNGLIAQERIFGADNDSIRSKINLLPAIQRPIQVSAGQSADLRTVDGSFPEYPVRQQARIVDYCRRKEIALQDFARNARAARSILDIAARYEDVLSSFEWRDAARSPRMNAVRDVGNYLIEVNKALQAAVDATGGKMNSVDGHMELAETAAFLHSLEGNSLNKEFLQSLYECAGMGQLFYLTYRSGSLPGVDQNKESIGVNLLGGACKVLAGFCEKQPDVAMRQTLALNQENERFYLKVLEYMTSKVTVSEE